MPKVIIRRLPVERRRRLDFFGAFGIIRRQGIRFLHQFGCPPLARGCETGRHLRRFGVTQIVGKRQIHQRVIEFVRVGRPLILHQQTRPHLIELHHFRRAVRPPYRGITNASRIVFLLQRVNDEVIVILHPLIGMAGERGDFSAAKTCRRPERGPFIRGRDLLINGRSRRKIAACLINLGQQERRAAIIQMMHDKALPGVGEVALGGVELPLFKLAPPDPQQHPSRGIALRDYFQFRARAVNGGS